MSDKLNLPINGEIKAKKVRLINVDGTNEVMSTREAQDLAYFAEVDLVQMNEGDIPTCKLFDYSDYKYKQKKAAKERDKKQREKATVTKEIKLSVDIQEHDLAIKRKQISKFLDEGKQVLITLKLKGRQKYDEGMQQLGRDKVELFIQTIDNFSFVQGVSQNGATISVTIKKA